MSMCVLAVANGKGGEIAVNATDLCTLSLTNFNGGSVLYCR